MRVLFLHPNFPAQFRHVAAAIAKDSRHQVVFGTNRRDGSLPGVYKALYAPKREARPETHHYVHPLENAVLRGQAVYRMADELKARGFVPDVVYGHSGWGPTLFCKDIFPQAKLLCYFEWFYHARGTDADFDPSDPLSVDGQARIRIKNAPILTDLYTCDGGLSPTYWQRSQFPPEYHSKITVCHDGVDTAYFQPQPGAKLVLPRLNLDLSQAAEVVTYVGRGMEPYRGFPQFMEAVADLQQRRPHCHVVVVGSDRVAYGKPLPDGKTYKTLMLETLPLDLSRLHFTGSLPYDEYRQVLQASSVHVYLTRPFVLSWSMIEAMASGCLVVASATPPVKEVIQDGHNGLLVDFFSPSEIADRIAEALDHPDRMAALRANARATALAHYDLAKLLPQHVQWVQAGLEGPMLFSTGRPGAIGGDPGSPAEPVSTAPAEASATAAPAADSPGANSPGADFPEAGSPAPEPHAPASPAASSPAASSPAASSPAAASSAADFAAASAPAADAAAPLQIGDYKVAPNDLLPLLSQYQLLPKLWQESLIDEAIEPFACTPQEQAQCVQEFYAQRHLTTPAAQADWLRQQGLSQAQLVATATRPLRIEAFKRATWGSTLEDYFLKRKPKLDQVVYNLLRVQDKGTALELYFRIKDDRHPFAELARQYSQGDEAKTGGAIGPVPLGAPHPRLAHFLSTSQPGQVCAPQRIGDWWVVVQLERLIPARFDAAMEQQLLDERFSRWLAEKSQPSRADAAPVDAKKSPKKQRGFAPVAGA